MTEWEIVVELMGRSVELANRECVPLRALTDDGDRQFRVGPWAFEVHRYVPKNWSMTGPKFGDVRTITIRRYDGYLAVFWILIEPGKTELKAEYELCETELIPYLRRLMILEDIISG